MKSFPNEDARIDQSQLELNGAAVVGRKLELKKPNSVFYSQQKLSIIFCCYCCEWK